MSYMMSKQTVGLGIPYVFFKILIKLLEFHICCAERRQIGSAFNASPESARAQEVVNKG